MKKFKVEVFDWATGSNYVLTRFGVSSADVEGQFYELDSLLEVVAVQEVM